MRILGMFSRIILRLQPGTSQQRSLSQTASLRNHQLKTFFDNEANFGKAELRPRLRPGRSWTSDELRLKSNQDLHKLWYVCLKERNMLFTMQKAHVAAMKTFPNPERIDRVQETMNNIEEVIHERNDAFYKLETGDGASPPMRTVTSFMGFTYQKRAEEHIDPPKPGQKEYEVPYLDDDAYMMQKLWAEKEYCKERDKKDKAALRTILSEDRKKFKLGARKRIDRVEDLQAYQ